MAESSTKSSITEDFTNVTTPSHCIADFCLIPIGTGSASVSQEIAVVQEVMKQSGLVFTMHSAGTTLQGPWKEVTKAIGLAHAVLHECGVVRVSTDIRIGTRTDKVQNFEDKVKAVERHLNAQK